MRLCCLQSFDYDISPIFQELYSLKTGCTTSCIMFGILVGLPFNKKMLIFTIDGKMG